jgi:hypothetical protein
MKATLSLASILALSALGLASCASKPDLLVEGVVVDADTGLAVSGARVFEGTYAPDLAAGSLTDEHGAFAYYTYPEEHTVFAEKEGYETRSATIALNPLSRRETLRLRLAPSRR